MLLLVDCRARLEIFVRAAFGISLTVGEVDPPDVPSWLRRWAQRIPRHLIGSTPLAETDGDHLRLVGAVVAQSETGSGWAFYRLCAAEMAARVQRGTPACLPTEPLVRDLYLLREAEIVDCSLSLELPGLKSEISSARNAALFRRPSASLLTPQEAAVEELVVSILSVEFERGACTSSCPEDSRSWAEVMARDIRTRGGIYRGLPPVELWGLVKPLACSTRRIVSADREESGKTERPRVSKMRRRPRVRRAPEDEDDESMGLWMIQLDDPQEHVEDPMGLQRPTDRDAEADPEGLADSLAELPEARLVASPERPKEVLVSNDPPPTSVEAAAETTRPGGLVYPEWDYRAGTYRECGAVVREQPAPLGDIEWAKQVFARRALLLEEVRRRFERLRARRLRVGRQLDGPEFDLNAYVASFADRRVGLPADDRLYMASRSARRDVAIAVLVDRSGSTDSWATENLRIVDVEKEALLVVSTALEALGDPFTILSFSGESRNDVSISILKSFAEQAGPVVHRRIAGLEPDRFTRFGAAVRHTTAMLVRKPGIGYCLCFRMVSLMMSMFMKGAMVLKIRDKPWRKHGFRGFIPFASRWTARHQDICPACSELVSTLSCRIPFSFLRLWFKCCEGSSKSSHVLSDPQLRPSGVACTSYNEWLVFDLHDVASGTRSARGANQMGNPKLRNRRKARVQQPPLIW